MSLESFFGLEEGESAGSKEASEKFQEQMRQNAKAIKALSAHQKQQSAKEDKLAKILVKFIQNPKKQSAVFLIVKLLQENIPGAFILAILSISDLDLEIELKANLENKQIEGPSILDLQNAGALPETVKADLNAWGDLLYEAGALLPNKTLTGVLTQDYRLKSTVLDLIDYSLNEYFERHGLEMSQERVRQFALLSIQSVLLKLKNLAESKSDTEIMESGQVQ